MLIEPLSSLLLQDEGRAVQSDSRDTWACMEGGGIDAVYSRRTGSRRCHLLLFRYIHWLINVCGAGEPTADLWIRRGHIACVSNYNSEWTIVTGESLTIPWGF